MSNALNLSSAITLKTSSTELATFGEWFVNSLLATPKPSAFLLLISVTQTPINLICSDISPINFDTTSCKEPSNAEAILALYKPSANQLSKFRPIFIYSACKYPRAFSLSADKPGHTTVLSRPLHAGILSTQFLILSNSDISLCRLSLFTPSTLRWFSLSLLFLTLSHVAYASNIVPHATSPDGNALHPSQKYDINKIISRSKPPRQIIVFQSTSELYHKKRDGKIHA